MKTIVAGLMALMLSTCATAPAYTNEQSLPSSFVKILTNRGYGSGTYIGNGYFLTANHVIDGTKTQQAKLDDGTVLALEVTTTNSLLDMAILHIVGPETVNLETVPIKCGIPAIGTKITMHGNPAGSFEDIEFVYTRGEVIGKPVNLSNVWYNAIPVDGVIVWGMSGGGAIDDDGNLVGITVGVQIVNNQAVGIGFIIPTQLICNQITYEGIDLG